MLSFEWDPGKAKKNIKSIYKQGSSFIYFRIKEIRGHILNPARLIRQEISLMKDSRNPRKAFEQQSVLLRDAFRE